MNRCITPIILYEYFDKRWYKISWIILSYDPVLSKPNKCTKNVIFFSYVEQLYKQSIYVYLFDRPPCVSHFFKQYIIVFIQISWNFRKHSLCGNKQDLLCFGHIGQSAVLWWPKMATVGGFWPFSGILIIVLYTLVKCVFKIIWFCGHIHQILVIWLLENGPNSLFLIVNWVTDHAIHFICGVVSDNYLEYWSMKSCHTG